MQQDNVVAGNFGRFKHLGIEPRSLADALADSLAEILRG